MRSKLYTLLLCLCSIILVVGLTGCKSNATTTTSNTSTENSANTAVSKEEQYLDESVFPKDKVVDVKITIDENDFQDMLDNASAEEYKEASLDYNGIHFDNIGIRTKGNLSLRSVVQMSDSDRYSFKLSFDEYVNQTLEGISKINLNNNYSDASYMREYLTYELAEQMGLPTPKYSFVNVYVNDKLWGFYLAVEQIDNAYLERNFGNSYGALYKGEMTGSGSDLTWLGEDTSSYTGLALKSETTNDDILIDMLNELNNGTDYEKYLDVEEALKYIALQVVTNNTDSYIGGNKQNYYLYEDDGVFSVLPWDYNMAFGGLGGGGGMGGGFGRGQRTTNTESTNTTDNSNAQQDRAAAAGDAGKGNTRSSSYLLIDEPTSGSVSDRPLVAKLLAVNEYKELYHNIIEEAVEGYLSNDSFTARVQEVANMIDSYVKADPSSFYTYDEYTQGVTKLISINVSQVDNISQQLSGEIASSGDGSGSGDAMGMGGMGGGFGGGQQLGNNTEGDQQAQDAQGQGMDGNPPEPPDGVQMPQGGPGANSTQGQVDNATTQDTNQNDQGFARGGGFPGGGDRGGFGDGGPGGGMNPFGQGAPNTQNQTTEAITVGASILVILLSCVFIKFFKRRRL
ncbi:Spore coat protein CotH [Fontibacillus panacisegetis]|uniref:Spore coat protein CotH n=1 Tax=Fontibacillus panacisegetis TaxID=670482 RepID=A0A1G7TSP8_9BACL|nr:CotH kinase family protein [Fontibacillus panacisegetis]SDG38376.1 Spore coat protein CotH [Fontibacillus panacisegetis]